MDNKKEKQFKLCDYCNNNANVLCYKYKLYFCENCYKIIHELKKNPEHQKEKIDPYIEIDLKCPEHPDYPLDLFCIDEKGMYNILLLRYYYNIII